MKRLKRSTKFQPAACSLWDNVENGRLKSPEGQLWLAVVRLALEDYAHINSGMRLPCTLKKAYYNCKIEETRSDLDRFFFSNQSKDGRDGYVNLHWICDVLFDRPEVARERIRRIVRRGPEQIQIFKQALENPAKGNVGNLAFSRNAYLNVPEYVC